ncbi:hypothetical protein GSY71_18140 [Pusillimonas sp. TS35]|uniref:PP0621 family protein n=1 Tax=Paracandidimonas lactea TaxID=2895524 RepID=UPI001369D4C1|nr:PP0621 family protein [Paracandidimonas lactea]MYN15060.1 hypothetical protein [Pusillimonas sp. TS35]
MGKVLFWVVLIIGIMLLVRIIAHNKARSAANAAPRPAPKAGPSETMVRCEHCGIHLPRSEAVLIGGHTWCSQEHARLGARK